MRKRCLVALSLHRLIDWVMGQYNQALFSSKDSH